MKYRRMKLLIAICWLCTISFTISACGDNKVGIGEEFSLQIGQSASIKGENLEVRFVEVAEDSRCPTGATCVWEGRVSCLVEITYQGTAQELVLTEPGLTDYPPEQSFQAYQIAYHVTPYPELGRDIAQDGYQLDLKISK